MVTVCVRSRALALSIVAGLVLVSFVSVVDDLGLVVPAFSAGMAPYPPMPSLSTPPQDVPVAIASLAPPPASPKSAIPIAAFEGLVYGTNGLYTNRWTPPDVQVAVGPNHVVEMVNLLGRIWTKAGTVVETFSLGTFFGAPTDRLSDPKVRFDVFSGRWFATLTDVTAGSILLEVSASDDPTGSWNHYAFAAPSGTCADQPLLGMSDGQVVLSANDFLLCTTTPSYVGAEYWVVNKTDLLAGASAGRFAVFGPDPNLFSVHPVQSLGATTTEYLVSASHGPTSSLTLFSVTGVPPGNITVSSQAVSINATSIPPSAPQLGSKDSLDTGDGRVQDAMWDRGHLWLSLNDGCTPPGDTRQRACARLLEVDPTNATVFQDFDVGIAGKYVFYPALRTASTGHLLVGFGYSSDSDLPGFMAAVRADGDRPNTTGAPHLIRVGDAAIGCTASNVCRYGDYFGAAQDPSDPGVVWIAGEYGTSSGWATYIAALSATVRLTLSYMAAGGGTGYQPPVLRYQIDGRASTATLTTAPTAYAIDAGTSWSVDAVLSGSGDAQRWATKQIAAGNGSSSVTLGLVYMHQYSASFAYRVTGGGKGYAAPAVTYQQFAATASGVVNLTDWVDAGSSYVFPASLDGSTASERWHADPPAVNGTVDAAGTIEVVYRHQALVTFGVQGPAGTSITPGTGWFDVGSSVAPAVSVPSGWAVGEWVGNGIGAYSGSEATPTIGVVGPFSETAILYPGLTISAGLGGAVSYSYDGNSGNVPGGSSKTIYVRPGTTVSLVEIPAGSSAFAGWGGAASGAGSNVSLAITTPTQLSADFASTPSASSALYSAVGVVLFVVALFLIALASRRRRKAPPLPPSPGAPPPPP